MHPGRARVGLRGGQARCGWMLVSERGVTIRRRSSHSHAGAHGVANALVLGDDQSQSRSLKVAVELDGGEVVHVEPADLCVTGAIDPEFELEAIDDQASGRYLCRWMATLMSEDESQEYEMGGYTLSVVSDTWIQGRYRVIEWEPTWETVKPSKEALDAWRVRKAALRRGANAQDSRDTHSTAADQPQAARTNRKKRSRFEGVEATVEARAVEAATAAADGGMAAEVPADAVLLIDDGLEGATDESDDDEIASAFRPSAAPMTGAMAVYGAVCTVWKPHLLLAIEADAAATPVRKLFESNAACERVLGQQRSFLWLSLMSGEVAKLLRGETVGGLVDAYPGTAMDCIHPSRRGTSKVVAFEGAADLGEPSMSDASSSGSEAPSFTLDARIHAPSDGLSVRCKRPWAPHLPHRLPPAACVGLASLRLLVSRASRPYLTGANSARPNTPRCQVAISLMGDADSRAQLGRAAKAALAVCRQADAMQTGELHTHAARGGTSATASCDSELVVD